MYRRKTFLALLLGLAGLCLAVFAAFGARAVEARNGDACEVAHRYR
jgi:hypothetical protein